MLFQYCLSDLIVVWRAWALWPGSRFVRWVLGSVMAITAGMFLIALTRLTPHSQFYLYEVCTITNAIILSVGNLRGLTTSGSNGPLITESASRALLFVPLMVTNVLATLLICYKAWHVYQFRLPQTKIELTRFYIGSIAKISDHSWPIAATEVIHLRLDQASEWAVP